MDLFILSFTKLNFIWKLFTKSKSNFDPRKLSLNHILDKNVYYNKVLFYLFCCLKSGSEFGVNVF